MQARAAGILTILVALILAPVLWGQRRGPSRPNQTRGGTSAPPEATPEVTPPPSEAVPAPARGPQRGPGADTPPNQGYVPSPEPPRPGTYTGFTIPSDPLDRGYWELYDKEMPVTLTGKVTKVDWTFPNSYIFMAAESGLWAIESSFVQFRQTNVSPAIKEEQIITILGYLPTAEPSGELPAKQMPAMSAYLKTHHLIRASEITTAFGQKLQMGRPPSDTERAERLKCSPFGC